MAIPPPLPIQPYNLAFAACFCIVSATTRRWILPVAVLGITFVK